MTENGTKPLPKLQVARAEAEIQISSRIEMGRQLLQRPVGSRDSFQDAQKEYRKWDDFNETLLRKLFDSSELADYYDPPAGFVSLGPTTLPDDIREYRTDLEFKLRRLESITEQLVLYDEPSRTVPEASNKRQAAVGRKVFLVHGRDDGAKQAVARFLEKLDLEPIILHEQANRGRTIIEKFEDYTDVAFAVVLLTPDDLGGLATKPDKLSPRARQNVVFELGYLIGKLGRKRVCPLYKGNVEKPSDYDGVVYVQYGLLKPTGQVSANPRAAR